MKVVCYLKLEPTFRNDGQIKKLRVTNVTQGRPWEGVSVRVELDVPVEKFEPLEAVLVVPEDHVLVTARTVGDEDPA